MRSKYKIIALLAALIIFLVTINSIVVFLDNTPFHNDSISFYYYASQINNLFSGERDFHWTLLLPVNNKPPLCNYFSAIFLLFDTWFPGPDISVLSVQLFYILLIISVYATVLALIPDEPKSVGFMAAILTGTTPILFGLSRTLTNEIAAAALVWAAIALLLRTDNFRNLRYSILFGLACGFGMLAKQTFIAFIAGPTLLYLWQSFHRNSGRFQSRKGLINACIAVIIIASPWYYISLWQQLNFYGKANNIPFFGGDIHFTFDYFQIILNNQFGWIMSAICIIGMLHLLFSIAIRRKYSNLFLMCIFSFIIPFILLSSLFHKLARHSLAWTPIFTILASIGLFSTTNGSNNSWKRIALMCIITSICLSQFLFLSLTPFQLPILPHYFSQLMGTPNDLFIRGVHAGIFRIQQEEYDPHLVCDVLSLITPPTAKVLIIHDQRFEDMARRLANTRCPKFGPGYQFKLAYYSGGDIHGATQLTEAIESNDVIWLLRPYLSNYKNPQFTSAIPALEKRNCTRSILNNKFEMWVCRNESSFSRKMD